MNHRWWNPLAFSNHAFTLKNNGCNQSTNTLVLNVRFLPESQSCPRGEAQGSIKQKPRMGKRKREEEEREIHVSFRVEDFAPGQVQKKSLGHFFAAKSHGMCLKRPWTTMYLTHVRFCRAISEPLRGFSRSPVCRPCFRSTLWITLS